MCTLDFTLATIWEHRSYNHLYIEHMASLPKDDYCPILYILAFEMTCFFSRL